MTYLDLLDEIRDLFHSEACCVRDTGRDDTHVNLARLRVSGTLLHSDADESDCLLNILHLYFVRKAHLSKCL